MNTNNISPLSPNLIDMPPSFFNPIDAAGYIFYPILPTISNIGSNDNTISYYYNISNNNNLPRLRQAI